MTIPATRPRLLVIDDDPGILPIVERFARQLGFDVRYHSSGREAIEKFAEARPDVALVDLQMPELDGIDVLKAIRDTDPDCQVVLMTGHATVDTAVEAVKAGALDYLSKPLDFDRLERALHAVVESLTRREKLLDADAEVATSSEFHHMVGRSPVMQELFRTIMRIGPHARTVLVTGETGTGKELVARALHACGPRRTKRFQTVNCSAVVETLFESELFGHVRGAFTGATESKVGLFEHAHQGTLFLDEAGELPLGLQAKLLRAVENGEIQRVGSLETRRVDVRVIAATNRDLRAEAAADKFRSDLFYRLSIIECRLPPLRDRREDIPYLTAAFVRELSHRLERIITGVSPAAERVLQDSTWPGNVRELRNVIERACILTEGRILSERDVRSAMAPPPSSSSSSTIASAAAVPAAGPRTFSLPDDPPDLLSTAQKEQIQRVLHDVGGNKTAAAKRLGVSRRSLYRWLDRLNLEA